MLENEFYIEQLKTENDHLRKLLNIPEELFKVDPEEEKKKRYNNEESKMSAEIIVPNNDDKNIATVTHLGGTVFSFIPALIVWVIKKDDSAYLADQSKEALNFQITMLIAQLIAGILVWILIGFVLIPIVWIFNVVLRSYSINNSLILIFTRLFS